MTGFTWRKPKTARPHYAHFIHVIHSSFIVWWWNQ